MSQIAESIFPDNPIAILSGPSFAIDVVNNKPTAVTLACKDLKIGKNIAESISLPTFRPYLSEDVIGAQIGGATKNVIAIAAGVVEGQKMGDSARAATIARGFSEIKKLAVQNKIDMPITQAVNDLIEEKYSVTDIIDNLLNRPIKEEN